MGNASLSCQPRFRHAVQVRIDTWLRLSSLLLQAIATRTARSTLSSTSLRIPSLVAASRATLCKCVAAPATSKASSSAGGGVGGGGGGDPGGGARLATSS